MKKEMERKRQRERKKERQREEKKCEKRWCGTRRLIAVFLRAVYLYPATQQVRKSARVASLCSVYGVLVAFVH